MATRTIGDEWISEGVLPVLQVPSAVIPTEFTLLLNPLHKEFRKLGIRFDRRWTDKS
jgi:hypothetical protein